MCFNSILVRLKDTATLSRLHAWSMFQFHTGSIKRNKCEARRRIRQKFQFHTGSIKRQMTHWDVQMTHWFQFHTGSIKRLHPTRYCDLSRFQFHTGSIKSAEGMVPTLGQYQKFQFHTGSIKSCRVRNSHGLRILVSIPYWFD